jgi:hypothetical protein
MKGALGTKHFSKKQIAISLSLAILFALNSNTAHAMMKLNVKCPKKFLGTVLKIANAEAPSFSKQALGQLKKIDVYFKNDETLRGEVENNLMIQTLKNGPAAFQEGKQYEVELRGNFLCSVKDLGKIETQGF